ncbi:hypothetical protein [Stenotrophomonas rhizophila]|uniref:hypothetical protein n=1 Tax=Stenotrophomonas rhizophila TaxID=216778 RepID=UPI0021697CF6|nr:hypothetical protein [Stenotrophomonas rhizophila]
MAHTSGSSTRLMLSALHYVQCCPARMAATCTGLLLSASAIAAPVTLVFPLPDGHHLSISASDKHVHAQRMSGRRRAISVDDDLRRVLMQADTVFPINRSAFMLEGGPGVTLFVRTPSNPAHPMAYCGSGREDQVLLIEVRANRLALLDRLLLDSCLRSIAVIADLGDWPQEAVEPMAHPWVARFQALNMDGPYPRCVRIAQQRLWVDDSCETRERPQPE